MEGARSEMAGAGAGGAWGGGGKCMRQGVDGRKLVGQPQSSALGFPPARKVHMPEGEEKTRSPPFPSHFPVSF